MITIKTIKQITIKHLNITIKLIKIKTTNLILTKKSSSNSSIRFHKRHVIKEKVL